MDEKSRRFAELVDLYMAAFHDSPPIFAFGDLDTGIMWMEKALMEGRPVSEKDLCYPDDAVI
jgi:hypothetical protein